jgi:hypothetical protein
LTRPPFKFVESPSYFVDYDAQWLAGALEIRGCVIVESRAVFQGISQGSERRS